MICSYCGKEIVPGSKICNGCGATVESPVSVSEIPQASPQPMQTYDKPATKRKSKPKKRKSAGLVVLSIFLGIILFFLVVGTILIVGFRSFSSESAIKEMVESVDIAGIDISQITGAENQQLEDYIYEAANETLPGTLTKQEVRDILESPNTKDYIAEMISGSLDSMLTGSGKVEISSDDLISLVEDTGINLTEEEKRQIETEMKNKEIEEVEIVNITGENEGVFGKIRFFGSTILFSIMIVAIICIVVLLFVINIHFVEKALFDISVPTFLGGLVVWTPMRFASNLKEIISSIDRIPSDIINLLIDQVTGSISQVSVITMAIGAVVFLTYIAISLIKVAIRKMAK